MRIWNKSVHLVLVGAMAFHGPAMASQRTHGVADSAIAEAKLNLNEMKTKIVAIDALLENAQKTLLEKGEVSLFDTISMTTAAISAGLAGFAVYKGGTRSTGGVFFQSSFGGMVIQFYSIVPTILSVVSGALSNNPRERLAEIARVNKQIEEFKTSVNEEPLLQPSMAAYKKQFNDSLTRTQLALERLKTRTDDRQKRETLIHVAQSIGAGLMVGLFFIPRHDDIASRVFLTGSAVMQIANIANLISFVTPRQRQDLVEEITESRKTLKRLLIAL